MKTATAVIDSSALISNYNYLKKVSGTDVMAVLKANAYGHGAIGVSRILRGAGMKWFGVATIGEAINLREAGDTGRILAWLYSVDQEAINLAISNDIDLAIFDAAQISAISALINDDEQLRIHLHIDTGMSRGGLTPSDTLTAAALVTSHPNLKLIGCFTHLVSSEEPDQSVVNRQLSDFRQIKQDFHSAGLTDVLFHIANSGGAINYDVSDFDFVRSGISIYGIDPSDKPNQNLIPAMQLTAPVIQLKKLPITTGIGYGHTYITNEAQRVALVSIGYADGVPRTASGAAFVLLNNSLRKVLGTISMDQIVIEANDGDFVGDLVTIFGNPANGYPSVIDLAKSAGTISYEVLVRIGERVAREYV
jgi:alanine racemase